MDQSISQLTVTPEFKDMLANIWQDDDNMAILDRLTKTAHAIQWQGLEIGEQANENLENNADLKMQVAAYQTIFQWLEEAKHFMIGWRDITFEQYKGILMEADGKTKVDALAHFNVTAQDILTKAQQDLSDSLAKAQNFQMMKAGDIKRQLRSWSNAQNPYTIYKKQLEELAAQCTTCNRNLPILLQQQVLFEQIAKAIKESNAQIKIQLEQLKKVLSDLIKDLKNHTEPKEELALVQKVESTISFDNLQMSFNADLEQMIEQLVTKVDTPIATNGGMMVNRDIALQRQVRRWILSEIKPLLYEVWEIRDNLTTGGKMIFMNLKNQLNILIAQHEHDVDLPQTLNSSIAVSNTFLEQVDHQLQEFERISDQIHDRLDTTFKISNIFDTQHEFLPLQSQTAMNPILLNQRDLFSRVQQWWNTQVQKFENYQAQIDFNNDLSTSEQVIRYIEYRKRGVNHDYYQNIFLTKGYVGEAFWVGRQDELRRVGAVIDNWKLGYRGTVLLTGKRSSGKSLFGEVIANRHFRNQTIHLFPNAQIKIGDKTIQTTYNLNNALHHIKRQIKGRTCLVWIDNLEMWWDTKTSLNANIRHLKKFMDVHGQQVFFMIATSDIFKNHLARTHDIEGLFQADIELEDFPVQNLEQTISIRHGATHKNLVNTVGDTLSPQVFKKTVRKIFKAAHGNVGVALQLWCNAIKLLDNNQVQVNFETPPLFPDFLNPNTATLLTSIALQKRTNEFLLRHLFGPAYNQKYAALVKRLLSIGILTKKIDGWLEINELVVHEVINLLRRKKYLI